MDHLKQAGIHLEAGDSANDEMEATAIYLASISCAVIALVEEMRELREHVNSIANSAMYNQRV